MSLRYHRPVPSVGTACCVALLGAVLLSCAPPGTFECQADSQCSGGRCEADGWCSFPDTRCDSGQRYGEHAGGGLAGECVPIGDTDVGSTGEPMGSTSTPSSTTIDPSASTDPTTSSSSSESSGTPQGICGDGIQDAGEDCDDDNTNDGDGCDNDCTPSGETIWTFTYDGSGTDVARDIVLLGKGYIGVGGDVDDGIPMYLQLDAEGGQTGTIALMAQAGSNTWGIAGNADFLVLGGTQPMAGQEGFIAFVRADGDVETTSIPERVFDVAVDGDIVWVCGTAPDESATVFAYDTNGVLIADIVIDGLPPAGAAWDIFPSSMLGVVFVSAADTITDTPWLGALSFDEGEGWTASWSVPGNGGAYGLSPTWTDGLLVSGNAGNSGVVAAFDLMGNERWAQTLTTRGGLGANIHKAAGGPMGEVVAIGWIKTSETDADIWVGKYSSEGELLWERTFEGSGETDSNGWSIAVDEAGLITAVGGLNNADTGYDAWIMRIEP
jgi:cysteine-rich repeat protein